MRVVGNQVWKFKNKDIRLRPSHVPESLTREGGGEARPACGAVSQLGPLQGGCSEEKSRESYWHEDLTALVFFVLKFAWFLIKD